MNSIVFVLLYTIIVLVLVVYGGDVRSTTDRLNLPVFYPPNSLFGIVWSILFIIFGIFIYYAPLYLQIVGIIYFTLVLLWTPLFVVTKSASVGFYYLLFVTMITIALVITTFTNTETTNYLPYLLIPQLCWVSFATIISYSIYRLN
jgi:tryptophan-rich sensory protein